MTNAKKELQKPEVWGRYILITAIVFLAHELSGFLEQMVVNGMRIAWLYLFIWYTVFIALGDQLIIKRLLK